MNRMRIPPDTSSTNFLLRPLILRYRTTLHPRYPAVRIVCPHAGEAIAHINGFKQENSNPCEDAWARFTSAQDFKLASWFIQSIVPKSGISESFTSGLGSSVFFGYTAMHTLENHLVSLDPHSSYLQWFQEHVEDNKRTLPFLYRKVLDCVRYLVRQIAYQDDFISKM